MIENKKAYMDLKRSANPITNSILLIYKGCLIRLYIPDVTNPDLPFNPRDTPISFCPAILIIKNIVNIAIPMDNETGVGIGIFGVNRVNGKIMGGITKTIRMKISTIILGTLFFILSIPNKLISSIVVI